MVMEEMPKPRETFVLLRGQYDKRGEKVAAGVPGMLAAKRQAAANRLELARWLVSPENPLTARVIVNRLLAALFRHGTRQDPRRTSAARAKRRRTPNCSTGSPPSSSAAAGT